MAGMLMRHRRKGSKEDLEIGGEGERWRGSEGALQEVPICFLESVGSLGMAGLSLSWSQGQGGVGALLPGWPQGQTGPVRKEADWKYWLKGFLMPGMVTSWAWMHRQKKI